MALSMMILSRHVLFRPGSKPGHALPSLLSQLFKDLTGTLVERQIMDEKQFAKGSDRNCGRRNIFDLPEFIVAIRKVIGTGFLILLARRHHFPIALKQRILTRISKDFH